MLPDSHPGGLKKGKVSDAYHSKDSAVMLDAATKPIDWHSRIAATSCRIFFIFIIFIIDDSLLELNVLCNGGRHYLGGERGIHPPGINIESLSPLRRAAFAMGSAS